jgi:hypothetical protein
MKMILSVRITAYPSFGQAPSREFPLSGYATIRPLIATRRSDGATRKI